jgi:hypothetical protein
VQLKGAANGVGAARALLGSYLAPSVGQATLVSVAWQAFGHGDVVFIVAGNWNPINGHVHPHRFDDVIVMRQELGEDNTPIEPLVIPAGATVQFLARAHTGADSASFVADIELI